jgi:hypothetical protein
MTTIVVFLPTLSLALSQNHTVASMAWLSPQPEMGDSRYSGWSRSPSCPSAFSWLVKGRAVRRVRDNQFRSIGLGRVELPNSRLSGPVGPLNLVNIVRHSGPGEETSGATPPLDQTIRFRIS